tara:strand:+ start:23 stop:904 length:882 start_codon:yes stop_codon:yes gene_type:complete
MIILSTYLKSLRPHQWLKNFLIFIPLLAAHNTNLEIIRMAVIIFFSFSLMASSVYIINDIIDLKADRAHPLKRYRIFASGKISLNNGKILAILLFIFSIFIALNVNKLLIIILVFYFLISNFYSLMLKKIIILDICTLAILYTSRIITGGIVLDIELSVWLLAFSLFFFFSLAAIKRQAELVDLIKRKKLKSLNRGYKTSDLPIISMSALGAGYISVLIMAFYVNSPEVMQLYSQPQALWGICMVLLFWLTKISLVTQRGMMHYDPIIFAVKDKMSQVCFILILFFILIGILF